MGDEMRIALREGGLTWGFICMHRASNATPFSASEAALLRDIGPLLASGLRNALLLERKTPGRRRRAW
jgi:GAF domain-containing protein